uniref:Uncharacterized protein n=1 Tax=Heliothis virescens TaxID=7102 RepID=A0A2A4K4I6_HELVI
MRRLTIILCFISRVIYGTYTVQHHSYSEHISRKSRSNMPNVPQSYIYRHFPKSGEFSGSTQRDIMPYVPQESKPVEKLRHKAPPIYEAVITPYATPSSLKSDIDYEIAKSASNARYESSKMISNNALDKLKSVMHYHPIPPNEITAGYDGSSEYHVDDDDVRTSSRSLYDNWPYFYHSPYEYEHNKDIFDAEKAKDKRYVSDEVKSIIPVHEVIENDGPGDKDINYYDIKDNPITGDQPFFSFVLNDYFEKSGYDEDPLTFKGLEWGKDFDREILVPEIDNDRNRRLENSNYYSTISPLATTTQDIYSRYMNTESAANEGRRRQHEFNKRENGAKKYSDHNTEYDNKLNQYNGFKDFLDTFANKFGSEEHKKDSNIIHKVNRDKGENRKGFHRVYHKDEYQEDKEFFDNNNSSTRGEEKGSANTHVGGSEAYLRSQAAAAVGNQSNNASNSGKTRDKKFEKTHTGHDKSNTLENSFNTFIDVARQAALSNEADYADHYRI